MDMDHEWESGLSESESEGEDLSLLSNSELQRRFARGDFKNKSIVNLNAMSAKALRRVVPENRVVRGWGKGGGGGRGRKAGCLQETHCVSVCGRWGTRLESGPSAKEHVCVYVCVCTCVRVRLCISLCVERGEELAALQRACVCVTRVKKLAPLKRARVFVYRVGLGVKNAAGDAGRKGVETERGLKRWPVEAAEERVRCSMVKNKAASKLTKRERTRELGTQGTASARSAGGACTRREPVLVSLRKGATVCSFRRHPVYPRGAPSSVR